MQMSWKHSLLHLCSIVVFSGLCAESGLPAATVDPDPETLGVYGGLAIVSGTGAGENATALAELDAGLSR